MKKAEAKIESEKAEDVQAAKDEHKKVKELVADINKEGEKEIADKKAKVAEGVAGVPKKPVGSSMSDAEWHTANLGDHHFSAAVQIASEHKHKKRHAKKHHHHHSKK